MTGTDGDDLFAPPDIPRRGARGYAVAAFVAGLGALLVVPIVLGPIGMALGIIGHLKGARLGFPAAVLAGITMIIGMALGQLLGSAATG